MLQPRRSFFPEPAGEPTPFETMPAVLEVTFNALWTEQERNGNSTRFAELARTWGRSLMLCLHDAAERYQNSGGKDFAPVKIGKYEIRAVVTEVYETEDPHFSMEIQRRGEPDQAGRPEREEYKLSVSTFDGMRDEGMFPPQLDATIVQNDRLEIRYRVFIPWNRIATIERTEVKDSPEPGGQSLYASRKLQINVYGPED